MKYLRLVSWALAVPLAMASACKGSGSPDRGKADPWGASPAKPDGSAPPVTGDFDADGIKQMLEKIAETIERPGPYEAPKTSAEGAADKPHAVLLDLSGAVTELERYSWSGASGLPLYDARLRLRQFAKDANVTAVLLRIDGLEISLADAYELRESMAAVRAAGKKIQCHAERLGNAEYVVAAACDAIALAPLGELVITGPYVTSMHLKGLLDRVGVTADFLHVGAYKGAAEPLTRRDPSPEMRETLQAIVDSAHAWMVDVIARDRKLTPAAATQAIDTAQFSAEDAKAAGLVDHVVTFEAWRDGAGPWIRESWEDANSVKSTMRAMAFLGVMPARRPSGAHVAVVYAVGNIGDGAGDGLLGAREGIFPHTLVPALSVLAQDEAVKAVVLRIDSGGGSALASELIWQQLEALAAKKPLIVSMSDYAASGGYYIASPAARIFALPTTLTGSIGVVGGKLSPGRALAGVGIDSYGIGKGKRAGLYASLEPWNADDRAVIMSSMKRVYDTFVGRVAKGRNKPVAAIEAIAQGRVWTGGAAISNGLVDEIGGLDAAIAYAQTKAGVGADQPLEIFPPAPTLRDVAVSLGGVRVTGVKAALTAAAGQAVVDGFVPAALTSSVRSVLAQVATFATVHVQTVVILPQIH